MNGFRDTIDAAKGTYFECKDAITHKVSRLTPTQRVFIKGAAAGAATVSVIAAGVIIYKRRKAAKGGV